MYRHLSRGGGPSARVAARSLLATYSESAPALALGQTSLRTFVRSTAALNQEAAAEAVAPSGASSLPPSAQTPSTGAPAARPAEIAAFATELGKQNIPAKAVVLSRAQRDAASAARELDVSLTLPRSLAHLLLVKDTITVDDLANPAQHAERTYADLQKDVLLRERGINAVKAAEAAARARGEGSAADAAGLPVYKDAGIVGPDGTPFLAGSLALVAEDSLVPAASASGAAAAAAAPSPVPVALLYLHTAAAHVDAVASRLTAAAAAVPSLGGVEDARADAVIAALFPSAGSASGSAAGLGKEHAAWLAKLSPQHAALFMQRLTLARQAGATGAGLAAALTARAAALSAAAGVLRSATTSISSGIRTAGELHKALATAVGAGVAPFTASVSAAAGLASSVAGRLREIEGRLNDAAAHAARVRGSFATATAGSGAPAVGADASKPAFTVTIPAVAELLASPSVDVSSFTVTEARGSGSYTVAVDVPDAHGARLAAGHIPTMLAPLARLLTPGEWAALEAVTLCAGVSLRPFLGRAVVAPSDAATIRAVYDAAAAPATKAEYAHFVSVTRAARSVLAARSALSDSVEASLAALTEAGVVAEDAAAARQQLERTWKAVLNGEVQAEEAEALAVLHTAVSRLSPSARAKLGRGPVAILEQALARTGTTLADVTDASSFVQANSGAGLSAAVRQAAASTVQPARAAYGHEGSVTAALQRAAAASGAIASGSSLPAPATGVAGLAPEDSGGLLTRSEALPSLISTLFTSLATTVLPPVSPQLLSWAAQRAASGFAGDGNDALQAVNSAHITSAAAARAAGAAGPVPGGSSAAIASVAAPTIGNNTLLKAVKRELALGDAGAAAAPWWQYTYSASPDYRADANYTVIHERLLEAVDARDLGAAWALWSEHCRLTPQEGSPDILALEIVMDACARARRTDLLFNVLWPRAMAWRVVPTSHMRFLLLKGAALSGQPDLADRMLQSYLHEGKEVGPEHYQAVISACVGAGQWSKAYRWFNLLKRKGLSAPAQCYETLFVAAARAGRAQDCHYIWRALDKSHNVTVPAELYTRVIETFADQGNVADMEAARVRMGRKADGRQSPSLRALLAMFQAYTTQQPPMTDKAAAVYAEIEAAGHLASGVLTPTEKSELGQVLSAVRSGSPLPRLSSSYAGSSAAASGGDAEADVVAPALEEDGAGVALDDDAADLAAATVALSEAGVAGDEELELPVGGASAGGGRGSFFDRDLVAGLKGVPPRLRSPGAQARPAARPGPGGKGASSKGGNSGKPYRPSNNSNQARKPGSGSGKPGAASAGQPRMQ